MCAGLRSKGWSKRCSKRRVGGKRRRVEENEEREMGREERCGGVAEKPQNMM